MLNYDGITKIFGNPLKFTSLISGKQRKSCSVYSLDASVVLMLLRLQMHTLQLLTVSYIYITDLNVILIGMIHFNSIAIDLRLKRLWVYMTFSPILSITLVTRWEESIGSF